MLQLNLHRFQKTDSLKSQLTELGEEFQAMMPKAKVTLSLEPQSRKDGRRQKIFKLSVSIRQRGAELLLSKSGEKVYPLIHDLKHDVIRRLHQMKEKKITERAHRTRLSSFKEVTAEEQPAV